MEEREIRIRIIKRDLPEAIQGVCKDNGGGSYIVWINQDLDEKGQAEAFIHEALHIYHNDFDKGLTSDEIEKRSH